MKPIRYLRTGLLLAVLIFLLIYLKATFVDSGPATRILFIGNSYTSVNYLPGMFENVAGSVRGEVKVFVSARTGGGLTLENHLNNQETMKKISTGEWDFVVLQEQSLKPVGIPNGFIADAATLSKVVTSVNSTPVFFETWARKEGHKYYSHTNTPNFRSQMQQQLRQAYTKAAADSGALLAPVGDAWEFVTVQNPEIQLYSGDGTHPSSKGTYLAALVFYGIILGGDPNKVAWRPDGISDHEDVSLKNAARTVLAQ